MATAALDSRTSQVRPGRVLVVEDSQTDMLHMEILLRKLGFEFDVARDGEAGVAAACSGTYDFICMDLEMPRLDGFQATQWIHRAIGPASPFIAAVTGHHDAADLQRCQAAGMDYVLTKPVSLWALRNMLMP